MRTTRDHDLVRQGLLLLAFDLLVAAVVTRLIGELVPSTLLLYTAVGFGAAGVLVAVTALVVVSRTDRGQGA